MNELMNLAQSMPWMAIGIALVAINLILFALKITKRLIALAIGAALVAVGIYTGVIDAPVALTALTPIFFV